MIKIICLDAGHGLQTPGKRTPDNEREWSFNNKVLLATKAKLEQYEGIRVVRLDDPTGTTDIPLKTRISVANAAKGNLLISIHHNANKGQWGDWTGVETYTHIPASANPKSVALARSVHSRLVQAMGLRDRGIKAANFHMVREANMPAILIECGYMDSKIDIRVLRDDKKLKLAGKAIASGVAEYLGLKIKTHSTSNQLGTNLVKPAKGAVKIGIITLTKNLSAYARPEWGTQTGAIVEKGQTRHVYAQKNGWYQLFSGEWLPSQSGDNFDYMPVKISEPTTVKPTPKLKRVIVDGQQVGAFSANEGIVLSVSDALKKNAKKINVEEI